MKMRHISRPVILAACFLLAACLLFASDRRSAKKQAEDWVEDLYTVNRQLDWNDWISQKPQVLYQKRFGNRVTERGNDVLLSYGLPYVILLQENGAPVERSHVTELRVEEVLEEAAGTGTAGTAPTEESGTESEKKPSEEMKSFRYEVLLDVTLEKGINVLAPVVEQKYTGIVTLKRGRFSGWKLDGFTMK